MNMDEMLIKTLKEKKRPLSVEMMSVLTGIPVCNVSKKMKMLEKYNIVRIHKSMKVRFWKLNSNHNV